MLGLVPTSARCLVNARAVYWGLGIVVMDCPGQISLGMLAGEGCVIQSVQHHLRVHHDGG